MNLLELDALRISIGGQLVCNDLDLKLGGGQVLGILGRNGSGKTTLLHTIMGFHNPDSGLIRVSGSTLDSLSRKDLARQVGLLFQESDSSMPATVLETVLLGRHPYSSNPWWDSANDLSLARQTLGLTGLAELAQRQVATLSGGEKQRLAVALLLVQNPRIFLLDEPSNHLDIDYQIRILDLLAQRMEEERAGLVMASHDINLVARFCDRVLLLLEKGEFLEGPTQAVLNSHNLERAFRCQIIKIVANERNYFLPG